MKTIFAIFTAVTLFFRGCSDSEVSNNAHPLEGLWHVESYWAYMPPPLPTFDDNDVIWKFEFEQNKLTVTHNINTTEQYVLSPGVHTLSENGNILTIDGDQYQYTLTNGVLKIESYFAPGGPVIADMPEVTLAR